MLKNFFINEGGSKELHKLLLFILLNELGAKFIGGEIGGFLWVSFHFFLNPLYSIYFLLISFRNYKNYHGKEKIFFVFSILIPIFYLILVWKFNSEWVEFLNIKFK